MKLASTPAVLLLSLIPTSVSGLPADKGKNLDMVARDDATVEGYCIVEDQMCHYQYEGRMFRHPCLNMSQCRADGNPCVYYMRNAYVDCT
ncbi:hypothetical protein BJX65DRAFT_310571 [Aspergillus insuetus]